ncbi:MAG: hypothetical protein H0T92_05235 [Pyrinomonadaceae bacterium]|nr:hypothetical protein [Pyrinomonadaceae bacterium]
MLRPLLTVLILLLPSIAERGNAQHAPQRAVLSDDITAPTTTPRPRMSLKLAGEQAVLYGILADWAGAWRDRLSIAADGSVSFEVTASEVAGDATAQLLFDFTTAPDLMVFYAGRDGEAVAELFINTCKLYPRTRIAQTFTGQGYIWGGGHVSGIRGRPLVPQPASDVFAVIAFHTGAIAQQTEVSRHFASVAVAEQAEGVGKVVPLMALYLHEVAEVLAFAEQRRRGQTLNYKAAHTAAIEREAAVRRQRKMVGGFAGGSLRFTVPQVGCVQAWQGGRQNSRPSSVGSVLAKFFLGRSSRDSRQGQAGCRQLIN